jgi:death-on-curing protein
MRWLTLDQVVRIHDIVLDLTPGARGVRERTLVASALQHPLTKIFGQEMFPGVPLKAAVLMEGLIQSHPFVDGNKRTAVVAACTVLELNGCRLDAPQDEVEGMAIRVATHATGRDGLNQWIISRTRADAQ